jgi:NAD(P)-dependent dehydrogenase (short-subunit alcohol dehydrogenase family)
MTLLVTGGAGYIGSVVVERALARGHRIVVIDNLQEGHAGAVPSECQLVQADYGDRAALDAVFSAQAIDAVVHLAAETTVATSVSDPAIYFQNNTVNGVALLEAMRRHRVMRLVFSSTAATYGEPVTVPMTEDHPQQPINAYGDSKLMFEQIIRWYHRAYGLKSASFRYFNAAGATETRGEAHRHESHLIPLILDVAAGDHLRVGLPDPRRHLRARLRARRRHRRRAPAGPRCPRSARPRLVQHRHRHRQFGSRGGDGGRTGHRPARAGDSRRASSGRSGHPGGQFGSHPAGAGVVAALRRARRDHRHGVAVAAGEPGRLRRLTNRPA